ncbi:MAG: site-specific DNA-methyltransferase [Gemmatimonadetes bacterium]|nr:site-specific DNA-methyltransferase [Gemmatimonadota bacterium]
MNNSTSSHSTSNDVQPARGSEGKFDQLKTLLREMFQLDRGDLDFGLYRIMNLKTAEIETFLDNDLLPQVQEQLDLTDNHERVRLEQELQDAREQARKGGYDPDTQPSAKIVDLNRRLAEMQKDADSEADVYNHLANFFARYYAEGDFISQRRYSSGGRAAYLIPYDGEEVKLHWANADQYYVKTTENYSSYVFAVGTGEAERRVRFEVAAADNERDNIKEADSKQRRFVLADDAIAIEDGVLIVRFEHRPLTDSEKKTWTGNGVRQQGRINETVVDQILNSVASDWRDLLAVLAPTDANEKRTLLEMHVERYTAKNSFDYFIHKDLGGFLRRELDLYLNTEVLNLDDLEQGDALRLDRALARVRATRHIGGKIIDFLAQLEDFQKQLWLKKKFVLETNWCVTLDRVPEALYPEIVANAAQCEEWVELFAVDEIPVNGGATWSNPPSVDFLEDNPYLMLDTRHFDRDFTDQLLSALSNAGSLDEQLDGLMVRGENFQALNLLQARYQGHLDCVYVDPPYNTGDSEILYKNGYKDASWLMLMENRLIAGKKFLSKNGIQCTTIDDIEFHRLRELVAQVFGEENIAGVAVIKNNPSGRSTVKGFSIAHEYAIFSFAYDDVRLGTIPRSEEQLSQYQEEDEKGKFQWRSFLRSGGANDFRSARPRLHYPLIITDNKVRLPEIEWNSENNRWRLIENSLENDEVVWPISNGIEYTWRLGIDSLKKRLQDLRVRRMRNGRKIIEIKFRLNGEGVLPKTVWDEREMNATAYGTTVLRNVMGESQMFSFPKSVYAVEKSIRVCCNQNSGTILDYFAGSGTTGHAVINLNREDGGQRKFILVDMADYFDTVMMPRMKKVVYSPDWKDGKPVSRKGVTQLFKYLQLESYEDTMDSLDVTPPSGAQQDLLAENPALAEDYRLRYALGEETAGSACLLGKAFSDPFSYTLSVVRDGVRREVQVDLPETFNYLIGLRVASCQRIDGVLAIAGTDPEGRNCLILWRNLDETDCAALDAWFDRNRDLFAEPLDIIYVNGDHTLNAMQRPGENWTAKTIEPIFRELMFGEINDER